MPPKAPSPWSPRKAKDVSLKSFWSLSSILSQDWVLFPLWGVCDYPHSVLGSGWVSGSWGLHHCGVLLKHTLLKHPNLLEFVSRQMAPPCAVFWRHLACYRLHSELQGGEQLCGFEKDVSMPRSVAAATGHNFWITRERFKSSKLENGFLPQEREWRNFHVRHQDLEGLGLCPEPADSFCGLQFQRFSTISEVLLVLCFMTGAGSWLWLIGHQEQIDSPGESPNALIWGCQSFLFKIQVYVEEFSESDNPQD